MSKLEIPWVLSTVSLVGTFALVACGGERANPQISMPQNTAGLASPAGAGASAGMAGAVAQSGGAGATSGTGRAGASGQAGKGGASAAGSPAAGTAAAGMAAPAGMGGGASGNGSAGTAPATAGTAGMPPAAGATANPMTGAILPPVDSVDADGKFATAPENLSSGPGGTSGVFRPAMLGQNGLKHPIFVWSCGGGSQPRDYVFHMNRIASHGFVVVADDAPLDASGSKIKASIDWIIKENDRQGSDFYQKLDTMRIGIGGHSMGALNTLTGSADARVKASILVCGGGGGGAGAAKFHAPSLYLGGVGEMGTRNFEGDYAETPSPTAFLIKEDTDHILCARNNLAPWVAFLRWNLAGDTKYKADFTDMSGTYCKSPWMCRSKNW